MRRITLPWPDVAWLSRQLALEADRRRLFPWIAVAFGAGIALYFQADGLPGLGPPLAGAAACAFGAYLARASVVLMAVLIALCAVFFGFAAAAWRVQTVGAPILQRLMIVPVTGFVEAVEERAEGGSRVLLRVTTMGEVSEAERPRYVRVTTRKREAIAPGDAIAGTARLMPPPQPAWPGGYDFARDAYFREIGAVGSIVGGIRRAPATAGPPVATQLAAPVDGARNALTTRIASTIGGQAGAVAAALVTGKRGLIDEETNDVLRGAGIYHVVSISGLHMVLAAGLFFWLARAFLALGPGLILFWPVKKIAAAIAMAGAVAYCVFSGAEVATQRSLIMTLVMFGAILVDRPALSIRNLALAAIIVLAREPDALLGPSFQMSFGAVAALTASAPLLARRREPQPSGLFALDGVVRWLGRVLAGLLGTTLVASLATAPFTAYHFQTLNPLGLIGNALALPLVSAVVMPSALVGMVAYPFGLDRPVWTLMGFAVSQVLDVSSWVSGLSGASVGIPSQNVSFLLCAALALLLATLMTSSLRWLSLIPAGFAVAAVLAPERVDIMADRSGTGALVRGEGGELALVGHASTFVADQWLQALGDGRDTSDPALRRLARCDEAGCVARLQDGRFLAIPKTIAALEEDCRRPAIIVTPLRVPPTCSATIVLDHNVLAARGAVAITLGPGEPHVRPTREGHKWKPWHGPRPTPAPESRGGLAAARVPRPVPEQDMPEADPSSDVSTGEQAR
jgi:competence protein ComEC